MSTPVPPTAKRPLPQTASAAGAIPRSRRSCTLALPENFRVAEVLDFHGRDTLAVAEQVDGSRLHKGLLWDGNPARLTIDFRGGSAHVELAVDGRTKVPRDALEQLVRRMLGLTQRIEAFEAHYRAHPRIGSLISARPGLRVQQTATPFEALVWAIIGQQISLAAAISIRRRLIETIGVRHSRGLACFPDADRLSALGEPELRQAGLSQSKARTLQMLSREVVADRLPLSAWLVTLPIEAIREQLLNLPGIGPWTVSYALLRGFGWLDGSLHGDVAVRRQLQRLLGATEKLSETFTRDWLAEFSPWRALVAAHLWSLPSEAAPGPE
jgi:DNA-3-methyladenine glycosylase II